MIASLDTNIIVRLFISDNARQSQLADSCLERYDQLNLSDLAIIEAVFVLVKHYGLSRETAVHSMLQLLNHPKIVSNKALFKQALPHYASHPALSVEDCCLAVYAQLNNAAPLLTFDKKLANQLPHTDLLA